MNPVETGLFYLNSRYYDPETGRFLNADEPELLLDDQESLLQYNLFSYCVNDPINKVDPSGHCYYDKKGNWCHDNWEYLYAYKIKPDPRLSKLNNPNTARDYIYYYLRNNFDVNHLQACAILGNIYTESWHTYSGFILQGSGNKNFSYVKNYKHNDLKGWGILQWTYHTRKKALYDYAKSKNKKSPPVGDLIVQLEFFNQERKGVCRSDWDKFKSKKTLEDMVKSFCNDYERAGIPHLDERLKEAKACDKKYKNQ